MHALLTTKNLVCEPIVDGDAGIILKSDGSFRVFTTGKIDPDNLTQGQKEQAAKLMALSVALRIPLIIELLKKMATDPDLVDKVVDRGRSQ